MNILEIENLQVSLSTSRFSRPENILKGISLRVPENCILAFLGPNGSGKTTTIKTILGLIPHYSGSIRLFGQEVGSPALRLRLGYAPENAYFLPHLTPREILLSFGTLSGLKKKEIAEKSIYWLEKLSLAHVIDKQVRFFSKGMKQRLALVQSLLHDPDFLIFDEPSTGLDPMGQAEIKELMLELKKRRKTVFVSTHHLLDAGEFCDEVVILNQGQVLKMGGLKEILPAGMNLEQFFRSVVGQQL
jgi:ABC-2 type transport system ATP-binding protein